MLNIGSRFQDSLKWCCLEGTVGVDTSSRDHAALNMNMSTHRGTAGQQESRQSRRKKYTKQVNLLGILKPTASSSC